MSNVSSAPRCTPPMPPVAKISMPASPAMNIVAATVVPAEPLRAATSGKIAPRGLHDAAAELAEPVDLLARQAHAQAAFDDRDRCGNGARLAHGVFDSARRLDIARIGHAMGDDCRFERHDRLFGRARFCDLGGKIQKIGGAHSSSLSSLTAAFSRFKVIGNLPSMINGADCFPAGLKKTVAPCDACGPTDSRYLSARQRGKIRVDGRQASERPGAAGPCSFDPAGSG